MIDNLDYGIRDSFPSQYNYTYETSMYLNYSDSPQGRARAYTEETRDDKIKGCEPCKGFSSIYYDRCYATEGNQCTGRSYPQCQRTDPHCTQLLQQEKKLYPPSNEDDNINEEGEYITESFNKEDKESFSLNGYTLTNQRILLIAIIIVCLMMLSNNSQKSRRNENLVMYTWNGKTSNLNCE